MVLDEFLKSGAFVRIKKDKWILSWGSKTIHAKPEDLTTCYYISDFFNKNEHSWIEYENNTTLTTFELQKILEHSKSPQMRSMLEIKSLANLSKAGPIKVVNWVWDEASKAQFEVEFNEIKKAIEEDKIKKLVPITYEKTNNKITPDQIKLILHRLLSCHDNLYPYGYWQESTGFIGATPELLFSVENKSLVSMALAGTRSSDSSKNLLLDKKECIEHEIVVDDLVSQLSKFGDVNKLPISEFNIGALTHLKTELHVLLKNQVPINEIISALHPTPALGGYPTQLAVNLLKQQSSSQIRKHYGAPFGIKTENEMYTILVAIRNIQWDENSIKLLSGCGVVEDSKLESEWSELLNKIKSVKNLLGV